MSTKPRQTVDQGLQSGSSFANTPLEQIRTAYAAFVQGLFRSAPPGYRWSPSEESSEILITDENPVHLSVLGQRPGVSFTRGPVQTMNLGIDDMASFDFRTGSKRKSILISGVMSINCMSRVDIESEQIAWVISEQLWMNRLLMMQCGFYDVGRSWVVGSPSPAGSLVEGDGGHEVYATVVSSPFQFGRNSTASPINTGVVEHMSSRVGTDLGFVRSQREASDTGKMLLRPHPLYPNKNVLVRVVSPGVGVSPLPGPPEPSVVTPPNLAPEVTTTTRTASVALAAHRCVIAGSSNTTNYADTSNPAHKDIVLGVTLASALVSALATVVVAGEIVDGAWSWIPSLPIFCGLAGALTQTPPTSGWSKVIGIATSPTTMQVLLGPSTQLP